MPTPLKRIGEYAFTPGSFRILRPKNHLGKNVRLTVDEMLQEYDGIKALMAAPMYGHSGIGKCGKGGLTPCTRQLDTITKVDLPSCRRQSGLTFSVKPDITTQDVPWIRRKDEVILGAVLGLQCYPTLVWEGVNKGKTEKPSSIAGLGVFSDRNEFLYVVAAGGTLRDLGALFIERGCTYAGYCDAGSSAALYVVGEGWRGVHAKNPKLPAWLAVM